MKIEGVFSRKFGGGIRWESYLFLSLLVFMAGFFFLSTRLHRNFYYVFLAVPLLIALPRTDWRALFRSRILVVSLAYIGYTAISSLWGGMGFEEVTRVFRHALALGSFVLLCACVFSSQGEKLPRFYKGLCSAAGIAGAGAILWFYFLSPAAAPLAARLVGPEQIDYPNQGAHAYGLIALLCHFSCLGGERASRRSKVWFWGMLGVALAYLLFTQSRGPLLALLAAMMAGSVLMKDRRFLLTAGLLAAGFGICLLSGIYNPFERGESYRLEIWRTSLGMFGQSPFFGLGADSFDIPVTFAWGVVEHAHNIFLNVALESGLAGLALFLLLLWSAFQQAGDEFRCRANVVPCVLLVFFCVSALFDGGPLVRSPHYEWLHLWLPIGLTIGWEITARQADRRLQPAGSTPATTEGGELEPACEGSCHGN